MSLAIIHTRAQSGIDSPEVTVEVHISNGLPSLSIVGLPETAVKESRDRVRSALINSHFDFPPRRITVNLAPADLPKEGGRYDLPIALGILAATEQIPTDTLNQYEFMGELALSGKLRSVGGVFPCSLACTASNRQLIVPKDNANEAALSEKTTVFGADHLLEVCAHLNKNQSLVRQSFIPPTNNNSSPDLSDIIGQQQAKRALEIAAAGNHNLLFSGPPGTGKSMLATRLPSILPPLNREQMQQVTALYSVSGLGLRNNLHQPPFRSPHHTASATALVGGGSNPRPGEISLAHNGVLFLDELPEYPRHVLEVLREPMESGVINISRVKAQMQYPASFQLIAAMNPCPCGYLGSERCRCTPDQISRYRNKISGPLLDRIDLQVNAPPVPHEALLSTKPDGETSAKILQRVIKARQRQTKRCGKANAHMSATEVKTICQLGTSEKKLLLQATQKLDVSARAVHRILKVARTIADLENSDNIEMAHISEALSYRLL